MTAGLVGTLLIALVAALVLGGPPVTAALMFLFGVAFGALLNALWADIWDLFDIYRER